MFRRGPFIITQDLQDLLNTAEKERDSAKQAAARAASAALPTPEQTNGSTEETKHIETVSDSRKRED